LNRLFSNFDLRVLKIAIPLIISNITIPLVGFVDNVMMGYLGSVVYIGAIGVGSIIISYILLSFGFIKSITTGFVSQNTGAQDFTELFKSIYQILLISLAISTTIILFRDQIIDLALSFVSSSSEVIANSKIYLEIRIWSIPAIFIRDILIGYYIGTQRTVLAMSVSIFINILNIILDIIFIYYLKYSIEGVAIASIIAEYSVLIFVVFAYLKEENITRINIKSLFNGKSFLQKISVNLDMFLRSLILMTCLSYFIISSAGYGDIILAANAILLNFFLIFSHGMDGFAHASEVLVGDAVGKKKKNYLINSIASTGKFSFLFLMIYLILFIMLSSNIIQFISDVDELKFTVEKYIVWLYGIFIVSTVAFWLDGVFIGFLKTRLLRNVMIVSGSLFFLLIFSFSYSANHLLWLSMIIFFLSRSFLLSISLVITLRKQLI
tara:strand:- start:11421 stop:12731 length:1311 start_codon:yes stop_codon:yes gene_type:complete